MVEFGWDTPEAPGGGFQLALFWRWSVACHQFSAHAARSMRHIVMIIKWMYRIFYQNTKKAKDIQNLRLIIMFHNIFYHYNNRWGKILKVLTHLILNVYRKLCCAWDFSLYTSSKSLCIAFVMLEVTTYMMIMKWSSNMFTMRCAINGKWAW